MKYNVVTTEPAERDLVFAVNYIVDELKNNAAAVRLIDEYEKTLSSLIEMPMRFSLARDEGLASIGVRFVPVKKHLALYVVREEKKTVVVLRFLYGKRDWVSILKGDILSSTIS